MRRLLVAVCVLVSLGRFTSASATSSYWRMLPFQNVTAFQAQFSCRSRMDCFRKCGEYSHCNAVAFQKSTRTCYLLPEYDMQTRGNDGDVIIYEKEDATCSPSDVPVSNSDVKWQHLLTSLKGDVTCHEDYVSNQENVTVKCDAITGWTEDGKCIQKYWISPDKLQKYPIPLTPGVGWKMCFRGIPLANATSIMVSLFAASGSRPMKATFNVAAKDSKFVSVIDGSFTNHQFITSPVLSMDDFQPFEVEFRASSEFAIDVELDNSFYSSYTLPQSVTLLTRVRVYGDMDVQDLDLWCE